MGVRAAVVVLTGIVVGVLSASPCRAQATGNQTASAPAPGGFVREVRGQLGASINNAGLQQSFDLSWRRALSASTNPLWSDAHVSFGGTAALTPAHVRGGAWLEVAPLSIVSVRAGVEPAQYFGTFNSLMSFSNRTDAFDTDTRRERGGGKAGRATRLYVTPALQLRAGAFIARTSMDFERWSSTASGPYFYEPTRDTLFDAGGDRLRSVSSVVLYERRSSGGRWRTGLTHQLARVSGASLNQIQRTGAVVMHQWDGRFLRVPKPSVTLAVSRYLDDPSKQGQWGAALAIGFGLR